MTREIPLYTLAGVSGAEVSTHYITTQDGLGLSLLRFCREPCDDVVMIAHGLTTSTDMFIMPEHYNLVQYLLDHGYTDVWCFDYRMSNRHPYNLWQHRFSMDDVALFDFPPALARIRERVGERRIHVIAHCLGSMSFMMSLFGKAVDNIASVVANSVALTPSVPSFSRLKLLTVPFLLEYALGLQYASPRWPEDPRFTRGWALSKLFSLVHRECDVGACHMLSVMWGAGNPALYGHENLAEVTHRRGRDLYGATSMHYYRHVRKMVGSNNTAVKMRPKDSKYARLPDNYFERAVEVETPVLLTTGENNHVFRDSNILCHRRLQQVAPGRHELRVFPGYGHQDVFMGKDVAREIFPAMLDFLRRHSGVPSMVKVDHLAPQPA
jgi:lysosomal acid lipase/cholesteryl ester hydrolase